VPDTSPCDVLRQNNIKHIDFLDIDVEGYEMDVVESIKFDEVEIEVILIEQLNSWCLALRLFG
jgi:hypothetical protein